MVHPVVPSAAIRERRRKRVARASLGARRKQHTARAHLFRPRSRHATANRATGTATRSSANVGLPLPSADRAEQPRRGTGLELVLGEGRLLAHAASPVVAPDLSPGICRNRWPQVGHFGGRHDSQKTKGRPRLALRKMPPHLRQRCSLTIPPSPARHTGAYRQVKSVTPWDHDLRAESSIDLRTQRIPSTRRQRGVACSVITHVPTTAEQGSF